MMSEEGAGPPTRLPPPIQTSKIGRGRQPAAAARVRVRNQFGGPRQPYVAIRAAPQNQLTLFARQGEFDPGRLTEIEHVVIEARALAESTLSVRTTPFLAGIAPILTNSDIDARSPRPLVRGAPG
jgi:hypothetical protein